MGSKDWAASCLNNGIATLQCIPYVFSNLVNAFLVFSGVTALFFIAYAGLRMGTSGGDPKRIAGARQTMTWAIVGLILVLSSFGFIFFISYLTKTPCLTKFGFSC